MVTAEMVTTKVKRATMMQPGGFCKHVASGLMVWLIEKVVRRSRRIRSGGCLCGVGRRATIGRFILLHVFLFFPDLICSGKPELACGSWDGLVADQVGGCIDLGMAPSDLFSVAELGRETPQERRSVGVLQVLRHQQ